MSKDGWLPPGVETYMIPGNRPEDEEVEIVMLFSRGEIDLLTSWIEQKKLCKEEETAELFWTIKNIVDQFDEKDCESKAIIERLQEENKQLRFDKNACLKEIKKLVELNQDNILEEETK